MTGLSVNDMRFRALVNLTKDIVYAMSPDWELLYEVNGPGLNKSKAEPITGWREKNVYPEDLSLVNQTIAEAIETKSVFELEHRVFRQDGTIGWAFSRAVPVFGDDKEII